MIREFKSLGEPLTIKLGKGDAVFFQFVYVGQSPTVKFLKVVPFIQLALLSLMVGIGFTTYRSITRSEQSNLWVGMAKEAAHQLGTPISSLFGWVQLMQDEFGENESAKRILSEIGKDISRLERVAERFGKIGSAPELEYVNIRTVLENVMSYMKRRLPSYGKKN